MKTMLLSACLIALAAAAPAVQALDLRPGKAFVTQAGAARDNTLSLTLGVAWPWDWQREWAGMAVGGATEVFVSHWRTEAIRGGRQSLTQLGVLPLLRLRFDRGRSPWFLEGGIGLTWTDQTYRIPERRFSTRGNFIDVLGVGRNFGSEGRHELSLRLAHVSNAGLKKPNPGEDFLQLRYALNF